MGISNGVNTKEFEYKGEKFSMQWNSEEQILFIKMQGSHQKSDAEEFKAKLEEFLEKFPEIEPINLLVNLVQYIKPDYEARRIYTGIFKYPKERSTFAAICGANIVARLVAGFMLTAVRRKDLTIKFFATVEGGVNWLKSKKSKK